MNEYKSLNIYLCLDLFYNWIITPSPMSEEGEKGLKSRMCNNKEKEGKKIRKNSIKGLLKCRIMIFIEVWPQINNVASIIHYVQHVPTMYRIY